MQVDTPLRPDAGELAHEAALVARAVSDPEAFGELYDRYVLRVYRFAFRRLGDHAEAEDVTAQTFHRAFEALGRFEWRGAPFGAWLFRIARNAVIDRRRAGAAPVSLDGIGEGGYEPTDAAATAPEDAVLLDEELGAAWAAVARLPALQRRAVTLRFGRDLSHAEVGAIIGRSEAATKQLVYRAMKTLRELLEVE
ncbi:MAG TPA: sigma-70 family RNA polymerase sigma factor [Dehalococcoidia bacterium]|nr:sigma-70 family RNA polymerase sigma factor [Dehalococcoidia bacterium]